MAGLSEDVLRKLITPNARALSSNMGDSMVSGKMAKKSNWNDPDPSSYNDFSDDMFLSEGYTGGAEAKPTTPIQHSDILNAIKQDMAANPIDTRALNTMTLESANGGNIVENNERLSKMLSGAKLVEEKLGEGSGKRSPRAATPAGGANVDYELLKRIINECLDAKLKEITEGPGILKGIGLSGGKIKLVDNKGNIFLANLEYKGKTTDKK